MSVRTAFSALLFLTIFGAPVLAADRAVGLWLTEPDRKDLVSHIDIRYCGASLCGWMTAAFDATGALVVTKNTGNQLFWDMMPDGPGQYSGGRVLLPLVNIEADATMLLKGDLLLVRACKLGQCVAQTWTRVR